MAQAPSGRALCGQPCLRLPRARQGSWAPAVVHCRAGLRGPGRHLVCCCCVGSARGRWPAADGPCPVPSSR